MATFARQPVSVASGGVAAQTYFLSSGEYRDTITDVTFSASYSTGGEAVTADNLGLRLLDSVLSIMIRSASAGAVANVYYDEAAGKLVALTTTAQVANATNLSGVTVRIVARGR